MFDLVGISKGAKMAAGVADDLPDEGGSPIPFVREMNLKIPDVWIEQRARERGTPDGNR